MAHGAALYKQVPVMVNNLIGSKDFSDARLKFRHVVASCPEIIVDPECSACGSARVSAGKTSCIV